MWNLLICQIAIIAFISIQFAPDVRGGERDPMEALMFFEMGGGIEPIHKAVLEGRERSLERILKRKADVDLRTNGGATALHMSAWLGDLRMTEMLIDAGANVNAVENRGGTPLAFSAAHNAKDVARALLRAGASVNPPASEAGSPLFWAASFGDAEFVAMLLERGAEVDSKEKGTGSTPLHGAASSGLEPQKKVQILLAAGAEPNAEDSSGKTPLHICSDKQVGAILLEGGANIRSAAQTGSTPLHSAVLHERTEMVEYLLDRGADPNANDVRGNTALHVVAQYSGRGGLDMAKLLIEAGADPRARNHRGQSPIDEARRAGNRGLLEFLMRHQGRD